MEWALLGLIGVVLGVMMLVGSIAGFFTMFSSGEKSRKLYQLEQQIEKLRKEMARISAQLDTLKADQSQTIPAPAVALKAAVEPTILVATAEPPVAPAIVEPPIENAVPAMAQTAVKLEATTKTIEKTIEKAVAKPYVPPPPNFIERGIAAAKNWLFGGNTMVRAGIVILFIGVSFLLKLAVDNGMIPVELRLLAVAIGGMALLAVGWRLRITRPQYAWALQGGGVGVLYLTIFAAMKMYGLIPPGAAFALLAAIAFLSAFISARQSALPLAILGFAGGFLAPILTSTGSGNHVGLFSYYLVLNLGIAYVALHKSWRSLNVLGFAFTFIIGSIWGAKSYTPALFSTTEPFLVIHFLLFTTIALLYAHRQSTKASDYVDATLVFGTPLVGFSLQYALLKGTPFGLAYSALALGIFYLGLAWWVLNRQRDTLKFLGECFLALGIGFVTLTLPLALDGRWTSAAWAVEGVGLLWVGLKQSRKFPAFTGLALQLLAALAFMNGWGLTGYSGFGHQNLFLGVGFIALSGWACGALLNGYRPNKFAFFSTPLAFWGWLWWVGAGLTAINEFVSDDNFMHAGLIFVALTSVLLPFVANKLKWQRLATLSTLLLPAMIIALCWESILTLFSYSNYSILDHNGFMAWPLAMGAYAWLISRDAISNKAWLRAPLLWVMAAVGVLVWHHQLGQYVTESHVWAQIGWGLIPMFIIGAVTYWQFAKKSTLNMLQQTSARTWAWVGSLPLMALTVFWYMHMSLNSSGYAAPLPYFPLLNPLDLTLAGALLLLLIWQRGLSKHLGKLLHINPVLAALMAFALLNGMLLRTLHHWADTPHLWVSIFNNSTVQMAFTFLWGITAFGLMLLAHKKHHRSLWLVGAGLMGLVVAKLFLLDLGQHGSINRIISFIGAGVMLLIMGYFVPIPPAENSNKKEV
ncbi:MAG TPA: DUF2339 domain-containing protein [Methylotenera sp.]|nr:DUF2339 domain-containing protein [Methylotenera sp.]HPH04623.1 DUF2339 domain-containing protein [Methylotenera sp.]HPN01604.1 DUF2339 domain-containing protein [Methylotenera sp.]